MRRARYGPRGRPPWWPENEPFPPSGGEWRTVRGRFMRRLALFVAVVMLAFGAVVAIAVAVLLRAFELAGGWAVLAVVLVGMLLVVPAVRGLRLFATPLGDLVGAAGQVEAGDLSVRVRERGPRGVRSLVRAFNAMTARLEASENARRRLLADVSHELRTPLAVVQGNLEALLDGVHPADETHLRAILDETRILSRLVEDLRTLTLAESGSLALHREPSDLGALIRETARAFAPEAERLGVAIDVAAPALPLADVDPVRVREILANLIGNALRYTPPDGHVRIDAKAEGRAVAVVVSDTGAGIPVESLGRVFDRFYKSAESRGAGLGLAIAKDLVEAHGGTIAAQSAPGAGTTIRLTLPVEAE